MATKIEKIRSKVESFYSAFSDNIEKYFKSQAFLMSKDGQWTSREIAYYEDKNKPRLTVNRLYMLIKQILSAQRLATHQIKVNAVQEHVNEDQSEQTSKAIEFLEGMVRTIAYDSNSQIAYQTGFKNSIFGYGSWLIGVEDDEANLFQKVIRIHRFKTSDDCYWDLNATDPLRMNGEYCGYKMTMSIEKARRSYNKKIDFDSIQSMGSKDFQWGSQPRAGMELITICHHFQKEYYKKNVCLLANENGQSKVVDQDKYEEELKALNEQVEQENAMNSPEFIAMMKYEKVDEKEITTHRIKEYIICGEKILDQNEWPGKLLPMPYVAGDDYQNKKGEDVVVPLIEPAQDAQRLLNVIITNLADNIVHARTEKIKATPESVKGYEEEWASPWDHEGLFLFNSTQDMPEGPVPLEPTNISPVLLGAFNSVSSLVNELVGRNEASLGMPSNEVSGIAIDKRVQQNNENIWLNFDNLDRAIEYTGKVILELLPKIYDTYRPVSLKNADNSITQMMINDPKKPWTMLKEAAYEIEVKSGPSFLAQKEKVSETLSNLLQAEPNLLPFIGDLVVKNMDISDADEIAKRMNFILDPRVLQEKGVQLPPTAPPPPNPEVEMEKGRQAIDQQELALKKQKQEFEAKIQMEEQAIARAKLALEEAELNSKVSIANTKSRTEIIKAVETKNQNRSM